MPDSLWPNGLYSPGNSPGHNAGVGSLSLLQGIFPTQGSNLGLPHCRQILYQLSHKGDLQILAIIPGDFFPIFNFEHLGLLSWASVQFSSATQLCPTVCDPMDCSMPGFPVCHQLPELAQTHVHQVGNAIQPSPPAFSLSQHRGLFQWVSSLHQMAKVLNIQDWFPLGFTGLISLWHKGLSSIFSNTTVQKCQFFCTQLSL